MIGVLESRLFWRWWRIRRLRNLAGGKVKVLAMVGGLIILDQLVKMLGNSYFNHSQAEVMPPWPVTLGILFVLVALVFVAPPLPAALLLAGALGNSISLLTGDLPNPLLIGVGRTVIAFNLADLYMCVAIAVTVMMFRPRLTNPSSSAIMRPWQ